MNNKDKITRKQLLDALHERFESSVPLNIQDLFLHGYSRWGTVIGLVDPESFAGKDVSMEVAMDAYFQGCDYLRGIEHTLEALGKDDG